jgi:uncharacterized protein YndB with AHSA1/START domain
MEHLKSDTSKRELKIHRTLDAHIDLVWEVWTHPEHLARWWGPDGFTNTIEVMEVKEGGSFNLVMHGPDGTDYINKSRYREVVPLRKLVYEHLTGPKFTATITFEPRGEQTDLTWHMVFVSEEEFVNTVKKFGAEEGQKQNVAKLAVYLKNLQP